MNFRGLIHIAVFYSRVFSASSDEELLLLCWFLMLCCNVTVFYKVSAIIYKSGKEKQDVVFHIGVILYT